MPDTWISLGFTRQVERVMSQRPSHRQRWPGNEGHFKRRMAPSVDVPDDGKILLAGPSFTQRFEAITFPNPMVEVALGCPIQLFVTGDHLVLDTASSRETPNFHFLCIITPRCPFILVDNAAETDQALVMCGKATL